MLRLRIGRFSLVWRSSPGGGLRLLWISIAALAGAALYAAAISKPYTFTEGDTLSATSLNANFDALYAKVNELDTRLSAEEAKGKSWRLIYETDVTSATTSVTATGLDGDTDKEYLIISRLVPGSAATTQYFFQPNADATPGNYGSQFVGGSNAAASASRNTSQAGLDLGSTTALGQTSVAQLTFYAKSGYQRISTTILANQISSTTINEALLRPGVWNNSGSNIVSLRFMADQTNGIGAGSHIEIWARR